MEAYVINLDKRKDRLASFQQVKNRLPFPVKRFAAYNNPIGEDGCTQSHLSVIHNHVKGVTIRHEKESVTTKGTFPFVVFEDDCVLLQPWSVVEEAIKQLPKDWDALWLGANPRQKLERYSENTFRLKNAYCLHAVIYNSERMIDYIWKNHNTRSGYNLDIFYAKDVMKKFNCYVVSPICVTQLSDGSDIAQCYTNNCSEIVENFKRATE